MNYRFLSFFLVFGLAGCQGLQTSSTTRPELSLSIAEEMHVGKTKQSEILARLGTPDRIIDLNDTNLGGQGKIWAYFADGIRSAGRISFSFPANSEIVDSISWDVREGDPEQKLDNALSRFKGANFVMARPKYWDNPHASPDEVFYNDLKSGLTITYLKTPKEVISLSWELPGRTTTSESDPIANAPYPYCIADLCATPIRTQ